MSWIRPQSLSGLLSAALLLIVLPLTAALLYGAVQLRNLPRAGDVLVRDSTTLTQQTQRLYQHITAMERSANVYSILDDPRVVSAFEQNYAAFVALTLDRIAVYVPAPDIARVRAAGSHAGALIHRPGEQFLMTATVSQRFSALSRAADTLAEKARLGIGSRLEQVAERAQSGLSGTPLRS